MAENIFATNHFNDRLRVQDRWEFILPRLCSRFSKREDVLPTVEWALIVRRAITLIKIAFPFNLSLVPRDITLKKKPGRSEYMDHVCAQNHALFPHRRKH